MRSTRIASVIVLMGLLLAACGGDAEDGGPTGATESTGSTGATGTTASGTGPSGATGATSTDTAQPLEGGQLGPGTYEIQDFGEPMTITLGEGWEAFVFEGPDKNEIQIGEFVALFNAEHPAANVAFVLPTRVVNPEKDWDEQGNLAPLPEDLLAWFAEHPMHDAGAISETTIAGRPARTLDMSVAEVPKNGWPPCGGACVLWLPVSVDREEGPMTTEDLVFGGALDEVDRQIVVQIGGQQLLIDIGAADQESWDAFLPLAEEVLATLTIG